MAISTAGADELIRVALGNIDLADQIMVKHRDFTGTAQDFQVKYMGQLAWANNLYQSAQSYIALASYLRNESK